MNTLKDGKPPSFFGETMEKQKQFLIQSAAVFLSAGLIYLFFRYVFLWLLPFLLALAAAYGFQIIAQKLQHRFSFPVKVTRIVLLVLLLIILFSLLLFIGFQLFEHILQLLLSFPSYYENQLADKLIQFQTQLSSSIWKSSLMPFMELFQDLCSQFSSYLLQSITHLASFIPVFFMNVFLTLIFLCFFCISFDEFISFMQMLLPASFQYQIHQAKTILFPLLAKMFLAMLQMMSITFVILQIGLALLKIPQSLLLASGIALADALPAVGTSLILLPWSFFSFISGQTSTAIGLLIIAAVISAVHQLFEPHLISQHTGLPPVLLLAGMLVSSRLFGFLGMILTPLIMTSALHYIKNSSQK